MAYSFNLETKKITIPRGDTAILNLHVSGGGTHDGDAIVFRVKNLSSGSWVITKYTTLASGIATVRITSADTRELTPAGKYGWTIGVVAGVSVDSQGNPVADDDSDSVLTAYNQFMDFVVLNSGVLGT